jgi:hypothetical protein
MKRRIISKEEREEIMKMRGLGDLIKKGTDFLKIPQCEKCKKRQKWLNEKIPFKKDSLDSSTNDE